VTKPCQVWISCRLVEIREGCRFGHTEELGKRSSASSPSRKCLRFAQPNEDIGASPWRTETVLKSIHVIITAAGVLLAGCSDLDKRGVADAQGNNFADGQVSPPSVQGKMIRRGQGVPTGRYGRPATRSALEGT